MSDNNGSPSMTALLGLLAVAGYQNRDKLAEWFGSRSDQQVKGEVPTFRKASVGCSPMPAALHRPAELMVSSDGRVAV